MDSALLGIVTSTVAQVKDGAVDLLSVVWPVAISFGLLYFGYAVVRAALRGRA